MVMTDGCMKVVVSVFIAGHLTWFQPIWPHHFW